MDDLISRQAAIDVERTMADYISREAAIDYIRLQRWRRFEGMTIEQAMIKMISEVPTAVCEWLHDLLQDAIDAGIITETQASRLMDRIAEDNT